MGGADGKLCVPAAKGTGITSEADELLRAEIRKTHQQVVELQETIYTQQCQRMERMGRAKPTREKILKPPPHVDTAKMANPRLQDVLESLEAQFAQLQQKEVEEGRVARAGSKLHRPTVDELKINSAMSGVRLSLASAEEKEKAALEKAAVPEKGKESAFASSSTADLLVEDHTLLFGSEDDWGLKWDRRWADTPAGPRDEPTRRRTRQGTCDKVVAELGLQHFGDDAIKAKEGVPPASDKTILLLDTKRANEENAMAGGTYLLGRYDVVLVRACADFDREWRFIKGQRSDFWVAHAAALNIGESTMATDFPDYCCKDNAARSGKLDETRYYEAMAAILTNVMKACKIVEAEHVIFFPFGMGAFLRHLGQLDGSFLDDEQLQRLRRRLAHEFVEVLAKTPKHVNIHICLGFSAEEPQRNADAFLRALVNSPPGLTARVTIWPEGDSLQLAQDLAGQSRSVVLINGANRQLLGNHWFAGRAKLAIDENIHRRSWRLAAMSYLLNGFDGREPSGRNPEALQARVQALGGEVHRL